PRQVRAEGDGGDGPDRDRRDDHAVAPRPDPGRGATCRSFPRRRRRRRVRASRCTASLAGLCATARHRGTLAETGAAWCARLPGSAIALRGSSPRHRPARPGNLTRARARGVFPFGAMSGSRHDGLPCRLLTMAYAECRHGTRIFTSGPSMTSTGGNDLADAGSSDDLQGLSILLVEDSWLLGQAMQDVLQLKG